MECANFLARSFNNRSRCRSVRSASRDRLFSAVMPNPNPSNDGRTFLLTFTGSATNGGASLPDGRYQVAVSASLLVGLGFPALAAAGMSLIANTAPVPFAGLGTPLIALQAVTGLDLRALTTAVASAHHGARTGSFIGTCWRLLLPGCSLGERRRRTLQDTISGPATEASVCGTPRSAPLTVPWPARAKRGHKWLLVLALQSTQRGPQLPRRSACGCSLTRSDLYSASAARTVPSVVSWPLPSLSRTPPTRRCRPRTRPRRH